MLVLSRKRNEEILIDDGRILIRVVRIEGDKVRLGIVAPKDVGIERSELVPIERIVELSPRNADEDA